MKMIKFPLCLLLAFSFFLSTVVPEGAQAKTISDYKMEMDAKELKIAQAFEKLQYALNVEWDQKDQEFKSRAKDEFTANLEELRNDGVSSDEIQAFMQKTMLDKKTAKEFTRMIETTRGQNLTDAEINVLAMNFIKNNSQEGASFSGRGKGEGGGGHQWWKIAAVVVVVVVVLKLVLAHKSKEENGGVVINIYN